MKHSNVEPVGKKMRRKLPYLIPIERQRALSGCRSQSNTVPEFNGTDKRLDGRNGVLTLRKNILPFRKGIDLVSLFLVTRSPINFTYDGIIAEMSCIIRAFSLK